LCWAINSPSLVDGANIAPTPPIALESIDHEHLAAFLATQGPTHRVGAYFEQLLHYWLLHVRKLEIVATRLQLKDDKITVGEIDFLYRDETELLVHCEVAVKYYLHVQGRSPSEFPGPNARDNYEAKTTQLFTKQLFASEGRIDGVDARIGLMKGMIFYRNGEPRAQHLARLPENHAHGRWIHEDELDTLSSPTNCFALADKPHWLAPVADADLVDFNELSQVLREHFDDAAHPVMLSVRAGDHRDVEVERLFVVSRHWPPRER